MESPREPPQLGNAELGGSSDNVIDCERDARTLNRCRGVDCEPAGNHKRTGAAARQDARSDVVNADCLAGFCE